MAEHSLTDTHEIREIPESAEAAPAPPHAATKRGLSARALGLISIVAFVALWELVTRSGWIDKIFLASPSAILAAAYDMFFVSREIYPHLWVTFQEAALGFVFAIVIGVATGLAMGRFETVRHVLEPFVMGLYSTPAVALLPLFILWLGIGLWSKVLLVFLGGVFAILVNTQAGVRAVNPKLVETARAFTATESEIFLHIILPAATPYIVAGIRLAIGRVLITVFVAELFAANMGVGFLIAQAGTNYQTDTMFVGILLLTLTGVALSQVLSLVEDRALRRFREQ